MVAKGFSFFNEHIIKQFSNFLIYHQMSLGDGNISIQDYEN